MPFQISPGVNVSEIDLTTVVPAVQTTAGAIAGHFVWGPVGQRVLVTDETSLVSNFQKPNSNTADDFFTAANFLAYSNALNVVRVVATGINTSVTAARNAIANSAAANTLNTVIKNDDDYNDNYTTGISGVGSWVAKYPGELGNSLKVSVCPSTQAWSNTLTGNIAVTTQTTAVTGNGTFFTTQLIPGDILELGPDRHKVRVDSITSATALVLDSKYTGNTVTINSTHSTGVTRYWEFYNYFDVAPGTSTYANTQGGTADELHVVVADEDGQWTGVKNQVLERYAALSMASDGKTEDGSTNYYKDVLNNRSKYIWWTAHNGSNTNAGSKALNKTFTGGTLPQTNALIYGRDGNTPTNANYINGYDFFKNGDEIDIGFILGSSANTTRALHLIDSIAEYRKDCLAVLSVEKADVVDNARYSGAEADDCVTFRNTLSSSSYYTIDQAWKYQYDKYNDLYRFVPGNGDTAGTMVRTDNVRDPWYSPAGYNRGQFKNVIKLAFNPNKAERDVLYKNGINPVVSFKGQGTVLFGDKTGLTKPSAFDRINVRRLFIVLEKSIAIAAKYTLFEFNDEFTRANFVNLVEPFLRDVQGRRGIYDFRVICDETNNTPEVIDRNEFIGDIFIKPARSINYIQLNFVAVRTGVDFSEIVGNV